MCYQVIKFERDCLLPVAAVKTLSVEVAVVDAAVCGDEDVSQAAGCFCPVHHTEGEGRARPSIQPVSVGGERDGVTVTTSPHPSSTSLTAHHVIAGAGHGVAAAPGRTARVRGDHIAVRRGLLHGQAGGGGGGGGRHSAGHQAGGSRRRYQHCDVERHCNNIYSVSFHQTLFFIKIPWRSNKIFCSHNTIIYSMFYLRFVVKCFILWPD